MSRALAVPFLMVMGILTASVAVALFTHGIWVVALLDAAASLFCIYTLYRMGNS
jgi:uncharacterized membrane protein